MPPLTRLAQEFVAEALRPGDWAIDATVGNGWDTLFLTRAVGPMGRVWGCDVQVRALERTQARLAEAGLGGVELVLACHSEMERWLPDEARGRMRGVMFNLGYLPGDGAGVGDDPGPITRPDSTLAALRCALAVLATGGRMSVVCYRGHAGGALEADAVEGLVTGLDRGRFTWSREGGSPEVLTNPVLWTILCRESQTVTG
jgi:hypothetical protein